MAAEHLAQSVKDRLARGTKATEDEHHFAGDGVEKIAHLSVAQQEMQEIEELGHLQIVNCTVRLLFRWGGAQICLLGIVQVHVPG